jgi:hypothetical protein
VDLRCCEHRRRGTEDGLAKLANLCGLPLYTDKLTFKMKAAWTTIWHISSVISPDLGKITLKVISDQIKIMFWKEDLKSDQDHIVKKDRFLLRVKISKRTKQLICRCRTQKRTLAFVMMHKQHDDPRYANCFSTTRARMNKNSDKMILDQKRSPC